MCPDVPMTPTPEGAHALGAAPPRLGGHADLPRV